MADVRERGAVISGIGISDIGRKTGRPDLDMTLDSVRAAIADAGLTPADIDAVATLGDTPAARVEEALGLRNAGIEPVPFGGLLAPVMGAFLAVTSGRARHVLVYRTVQMMGGDIPIPAGAPPPPSGESPAAAVGDVMGDMMPLLACHAYSAVHWLAMHMRRHMHLYGTTKEQFGALSVNSRRWAGMNEQAVYREPITLDDYLNARPVSEPMSLLDCDVPIDGSIAVVVSAPEYAADCPNLAVRVDAFGTSAGAGTGWVNRPDYPKMASIEAGRDLWSKTSLTPADVDVAELYDGFTFLTFAWLEALGFCGEGESGPFVEAPGNLWLGGALPLNTYGGQLSAGRMHGYWVLHEACVQLRGEAGARQVDGAEVAVVSNGGGPIAGCMLLTR
jgi:acetyl-CoA acetyltransferase